MYLIGSFGGLLFDRYDAHRLIFVSLCICTVGSLCVPLASSIYALGATVGCQGLVVGFMDTGVNSLIFVLHEGDQVEPFMQTVRSASDIVIFLFHSCIPMPLYFLFTGSTFFWCF